MGRKQEHRPVPKPSMYGTFSYMGVVSGINVGKYASPMDGLGYCFAVGCSFGHLG